MTYDVYSANVLNTVSFIVEPQLVGENVAGLFGIFRGPENAHPFFGQLTTTPTALQNLAQLRTDYIVRALTAYAPVVGVRLVTNASGSIVPTVNFGSAIKVTFETNSMGIFEDPAYISSGGVGNKERTTDIVDTLGVGGMSYTKTKPGLQSLLNALSTVSFDNGVTGPFGALAATGAITLPDTTVTTGAPTLTAAGGFTAGLKIYFAN